jgi:hypothetical protein
MDIILYQVWLWLSKRWFSYRITGITKETHQTEVIIFASETADMEKLMSICSEQEKQ